MYTLKFNVYFPKTKETVSLFETFDTYEKMAKFYEILLNIDCVVKNSIVCSF